jgi:hypothetical protein
MARWRRKVRGDDGANTGHAITVVAYDEYGLTDTALVQIKVTDVANAPLFSTHSLSGTVDENKVAGTVVNGE